MPVDTKMCCGGEVLPFTFSDKDRVIPMQIVRPLKGEELLWWKGGQK